MHGLSTIRRLNGETLTEDELIAAARSAAARPVTETQPEKGGGASVTESKPETV